MVRLLAERYDTKSNIKFLILSQHQASYMSNHTEELWNNETTCLWMTIYIYIYSVSQKWVSTFHKRCTHFCWQEFSF